VDAQHLLDEVCLALDVAAPRRRLDGEALAPGATLQPSASRMPRDTAEATSSPPSVAVRSGRKA